MVLAAYLALFYGVRGWKDLESRRAEYQRLTKSAMALKDELQTYESRALLVQDLREKFQLDTSKLDKSTLVAEASAVIQKAATARQVQLGPLRETAARASAKELASMQVEGSGQVPALMGFLHTIQRLGYPIIIDSLQITPEQSRPGNIKINLTIVILDIDQWKKEEARRA